MAKNYECRMSKICDRPKCEHKGAHEKMASCGGRCAYNSGGWCEITPRRKSKYVRIKGWAHRVEMMPSVGEWMAREDNLHTYDVPCTITILRKYLKENTK